MENMSNMAMEQRGERRSGPRGAPRVYSFDLLEVGGSLLVPWRVDANGAKLPMKNQYAIVSALDVYERKTNRSFFRKRLPEGLYVKRLR